MILFLMISNSKKENQKQKESFKFSQDMNLVPDVYVPAWKSNVVSTELSLIVLNEDFLFRSIRSISMSFAS